MKRSATLFPIALALGEITLAPWASAQAQDYSRQERPIEIKKCQTISQPGAYKLVNNLTFTSTTGTGTCLLITADFVTIDLAGFTITGPGGFGELPSTTAIAAQSSSANLQGIAVRNGSISNFAIGVALSSADGSVVEGLRVVGGRCPCQTGIEANGIVRGNTVIGFAGVLTSGTGIRASGVVTGNSVSESGATGMLIGQGSTVIGNTAEGNRVFGFEVICPSNVTDNTALNNGRPGIEENLRLNGNGCTNTNNVAP